MAVHDQGDSHHRSQFIDGCETVVVTTGRLVSYQHIGPTRANRGKILGEDGVPQIKLEAIPETRALAIAVEPVAPRFPERQTIVRCVRVRAPHLALKNPAEAGDANASDFDYARMQVPVAQRRSGVEEPVIVLDSVVVVVSVNPPELVPPVESGSTSRSSGRSRSKSPRPITAVSNHVNLPVRRFIPAHGEFQMIFDRVELSAEYSDRTAA